MSTMVELIALAQAENGLASARARNKLIAENMGLVRWIAKRYSYYGVEQEDLLSAGMAGLNTAISKCDFSRGSFSTVAYQWIRASIVRQIPALASPIRKPAGHYQLYNNIVKLRAQQPQLKTVKQIADELIAQGKLKATSNAYNKVACIIEEFTFKFASFDYKPKGDNDGYELTQVDVADKQWAQPNLADLANAELGQELIALLDRALTEQESKIIAMLYGLQGYDEHSANEIAEKLAISKQRVSQLRRKAMYKLEQAALYDTTLRGML